MSDGHGTVKTTSGMVVQVMRGPSSQSPFVDPGNTPQRILLQQQGGGTMGTLGSAKRLTVASGRPVAALTPMQARFTASSRLGTPQSAPGAVYGIKRPFTADYGYEFVRKYPRSVDKSKGLRHFSTKVCEKVKEKGQTNYNEVADELVTEYFDSLSNPPCDMEKQQYDMKNIRRRVYDALNVLMAMNIIEKEKKEIRWVGLPTSSVQECRRLEDEKMKRQERIRQKAEQLQELIIQLVAYKSLVERNREKERVEGRPNDNSVLYLPYIVVNTDKKTVIDCMISHDKTEYLFNFDQPFEIHDDIEVLKRLGLAHGLERADVPAELRPKVRSYLPPALREYIDQILDGTLCGGIIGPSVKAAYPQTYERKPVIGPGGQVLRVASQQAGGGGGYGVMPVRAVYGGYGGAASRASTPGSAMRYTVVSRSSGGGGSVAGTPVPMRYGSSPGTFRSVQTSGGVGRQYVVQRSQSPSMQQPQQQQQHHAAGGGVTAYGNVPTSSAPRYVQRVVNAQSPITYTIQAPTTYHQPAGSTQRYVDEQLYEEDDENLQYE